MLLSDPHSSTLGASGAGFGLMGRWLVVAHQGAPATSRDPGLLGLNIAFTFYAVDLHLLAGAPRRPDRRILVCARR